MSKLIRLRTATPGSGSTAEQAIDWAPDPSRYPPYLRSKIRRGFGFGERDSYKPWLRVRDVPSLGTCASPSGIRITREFQLLSSLEETYYLLLERDPSVIDIREQFPILDLSATMRLCSQHGVTHTYRRGHPDPFTLDFLYRRRTPDGDTLHARSIKTEEDATDATVAQRLAIEYLWCESVRLEWARVETKKFTADLLSSLRFIRGWFSHRYVPNPKEAQHFSDLFLMTYEPGVPLEELIEAAASRVRCNRDTADDAFRFCAWSNRISVDLQRPIRLNQSVVLLHDSSATVGCA